MSETFESKSERTINLFQVLKRVENRRRLDNRTPEEPVRKAVEVPPVAGVAG